MSNLTDLLPAGAGGKQVDFVASGTLGSGVTVALKSDGTVEAVSSVSAGFGSLSQWSASPNYRPTTSVYCGNNKFVVFYTTTSSQLYAIVGTISGTTITYGTAASISATLGNEDRYYTAVHYDQVNDKVVFFYPDNSNSGYPTARVGSISGTTLTFGTAVVLNSSDASFGLFVTHDTNVNKFVALYRQASSTPKVRVGTVSGTAISFGTQLSIGSTDVVMQTGSPCFDSNVNKSFFQFRTDFGSDIKSYVVTVSGTSATSSALQTVCSGTGGTGYSASSFDKSQNKIILFFNANKTKVITIAANGTLSSGSEVTNSANFGSGVRVEAVYSNADSKVYLCGYNSSTTSATLYPATISGTVPSIGTLLNLSISSISYSCSAAYNYDTKQIIATAVPTSPQVGKTKIYQVSNTNLADFIGITDAAISDTASGSVTIKGGISTNVTGLTPNQNYYVQSDGTLATTSSTVLAGKALSSTSINLDYTT
jgi:hypothetical protein